MRILGEFLAPWMMCILLPSSQRSPYASSTILRDQWLLSLPPPKPPSNKISVPWTTRFGDEAMYFHPGSTSWILKGKDMSTICPPRSQVSTFTCQAVCSSRPSWHSIPSLHRSLRRSLPPDFAQRRRIEQRRGKVAFNDDGKRGNLEGGSVGCGVHEARGVSSLSRS